MENTQKDQHLDKYEEQMERQRREGYARVGDMASSPRWERAVLERRIKRDQARIAELGGIDAQN